MAKFLEVNRAAIVEIESGKRKMSAEELGKFSKLFQISVDESDQQEILNLIEFKRMMKERM